MSARPRSLARRLLAFLFTPGPSPAVYLLRIWPVAVVPGMLLAMAAASVAELVGHPYSPRDLFKSGFLMVVVLAPLLETLMMVPLLWLLQRVFSNRLAVASISAVVWAALHALQSPVQAVPALWGFFVMSSAFLGWRQRSLLAAFWVTVTVHALNNATAWAGWKSEQGAGDAAGWGALAVALGLMAGGVAFARRLVSRSPSPEASSTGGETAFAPAASPAADPFPVNLARASWVCPIAGVLLTAWLSQYLGKGPAPVALGLILTAILGLLSGIVALACIPWHGTKRIVAPALTGMLINSVILLIALVVFLVQSNGGLAAVPKA